MTILSEHPTEHSSDSRKYGRPKDPRLVPEMAEKVAALRQWWNVDRLAPRKGIRPTVLLTFDEMLDALLDECLRYGDIALAAGVSRERIRQIHRDEFSLILPYRRGTGWKRQRSCTLAKRRDNIAAIEPTGVAKIFADAATAKGLTVEAIVRKPHNNGSKVSASSKVVKINGLRVAVCQSETPHFFSAGSRTRMFNFNYGKRRCDMRAFRCGDPLNSWFIIPINKLRHESGSLYIPEHPDTYRRNPQSDWLWQYREAWHLLKEGK